MIYAKKDNFRKKKGICRFDASIDVHFGFLYMRFGLVLDDGVRVVLRLEFTASVLSEIMVYIE